MMSRNRNGTSISDAKLNDLVAAAKAKDDARRGITVFRICQMAILLSLAICDLRSKSTLRTGLVRCALVAELVN